MIAHIIAYGASQAAIEDHRIYDETVNTHALALIDAHVLARQMIRWHDIHHGNCNGAQSDIQLAQLHPEKVTAFRLDSTEHQ